MLVTRGLAADRLPWGNMYEFGTAVVLVAVVAFAVLARARPGAAAHRRLRAGARSCWRWCCIGLFLYAAAGPLVAALRSYWLAIHVTTAILGFGIFFVSGIASVLYLVRDAARGPVAAGAGRGRGRRIARPAARGRGAGPGGAPHRRLRLPDLDLRRHRRRHLGGERLGPVLGLGPEGDLGVHRLGRLRRLPARPHDGRLAGRPAAWVNVVGLVVMVFNLLFVNLVSTGLHSYAGGRDQYRSPWVTRGAGPVRRDVQRSASALLHVFP